MIVHFADGTYSVTDNLTIPANAKNVSFEATNPSGPYPVINSSSSSFIGSVGARSDASLITLKNITIRGISTSGENGIFNFGAGTANRNTNLLLDGVIIDNCRNTDVSDPGSNRYLIGLRGMVAVIEKLRSEIRLLRTARLRSWSQAVRLTILRAGELIYQIAVSTTIF